MVPTESNDEYTHDAKKLRIELTKTRKPPTYDVIVLGLGAAGSNAVSVLQNYGKKVLGLEAMDRTGGRIHTETFGNHYLELGAEWIHGTIDNSAYNYAMNKRIAVEEQYYRQKVYTSDGLFFRSALTTLLMDYSFIVVSQPPPEPEPLGQYISRRVKEYTKTIQSDLKHDSGYIDDFLRWMKLIICNNESCADWDEVSTQTQYEELIGNLRVSWHRYGYNTLINSLLAQPTSTSVDESLECVPNIEIQLNTEVVQIKTPEEINAPIQVICKNGAVYYGRTVIVTFSLGVLKERYESLFSPPLPEKKVTAINNISIGVVNKIALRFREVWWSPKYTWLAFLWRAEDLAKVPEENKWTTKIFGATSSAANRRSLVFWLSGEEAKLVETLPEEEVTLKLMDLMRKFFIIEYPEMPEPIEMIRSSWYGNPFTRGSYSFDNIKTPEYPNARTDLAEPICDRYGKLRLMFAGEATDKTHFSTVHGAMDSGRREALRFIAFDANKNR